jgi:folate-dependent phosphoribosylglycinamide formyltransferase PurN
MDTNRAVRMATILSGTGSDNEAVLKAHKAFLIPNTEIVGIIATAPELEGARRSRVLGYENIWEIDYDGYTKGFRLNHFLTFEDEVAAMVISMKADLLFALGCKYKLPIIPGVLMLNIHPQCPVEHGGWRMVGLKPHMHFLTHEVGDLIYRGRKKETDPFYAKITIHEITEKWDEGRILLQYSVKIPTEIIVDYISKKVSLKESAEKVQKFVLKHEHRVLPKAVNLAVQEIQDGMR